MCNKFENNVRLNITCHYALEQDPQGSCNCRERLELNKDFVGDVFMYYGLTNFYQNHRKYVKSRDDEQLLGIFMMFYKEDPKNDPCVPFRLDKGRKNMTIVPCGAIANSLFNDVLSLTSVELGPVPVSRNGIAWPSDKELIFRNPPGVLSEGKLRSNNIDSVKLACFKHWKTIHVPRAGIEIYGNLTKKTVTTTVSRTKTLLCGCVPPLCLVLESFTDVLITVKEGDLTVNYPMEVTILTLITVSYCDIQLPNCNLKV